MELDDSLWGFSNLLHGGKINKIAEEDILDLISEDIGCAMDSTVSQKLKLVP